MVLVANGRGLRVFDGNSDRRPLDRRGPVGAVIILDMDAAEHVRRDRGRESRIACVSHELVAVGRRECKEKMFLAGSGVG